MLTSAAAFLSYAHRDDTYHGGAITGLCQELSGAISVAIGNDFPIFQDHRDVAWGEHWPSRLEQGLAGSRFLIPILTPSFFSSDFCRKELSDFLEIERTACRRDLILPIYYRETPFLENPARRLTDPLAKAIAERQYRDWRELRHLPFDRYEVRIALDALADELVQALERSKNDAPKPSKSETTESITRNPSYPTPYDDQVDTFDTGASEGPELFRAQGLMDRPTPASATISSSSLPEPGTVFRDIDEPWCPEMVVIPPGSFIMGSPPNEDGHEENEEPEHRVCIANRFALGIYPVTFEQFDHFCVETGRRKPDDEDWGRGNRPVINVDVEDAEAYLKWLSEVTGKPYGLPIEAMWEYACRAGTTTPFSTGQTIGTDQANYDGNNPYINGKKGRYRQRTSRTGTFQANPFGLYDMHGNVWEWCADHWHESYDHAPEDATARLDDGDPESRVLRGGSWWDGADELRSAYRDWKPIDEIDDTIGFRAARFQV